MKLIVEQYAFVQSSREALFQYCGTVESMHFIQPNEIFGGKSMRDLLVHVARAYVFWIGEFGLKKPPISIASSVTTLKDVRSLYSQVDGTVLEFLQKFDGSWYQLVTGLANQNRTSLTVPAIKLFTHVTSHEFHHKGQVLTLSRLLGYKPADTDIIRF